MQLDIIFIEVITIATLAWYAGRAILQLTHGRDSLLLWVFPFHFLFNGLPLVLEVFGGTFSFDPFIGIDTALSDATTTYLYCGYMIFSAMLWWHFYRREKAKPDNGRRDSELETVPRRPTLSQMAFVLVLVLPFALVFMAPDPTMYLSYTPYQRDFWARGAEREFQTFVYMAVTLSIISIANLLAASRSPRRALWWAVPCLFIDIWVSGKRVALALAIAAVSYVFWHRKLIKGWRFLALLLIGVLGVLLYSFAYQALWRFAPGTIETRDASDWIQEYRLDYGRDAVIRFALYSWQHPEEFRIWESPWESVLGVIVAPVPRTMWSGKPQTYIVRLTEAAGPFWDASTGRLTTSWLAEAISMCGWFGFLLGPAAILFIVRLGNQAVSFSTKAMATLLILFLLTTQMVSCILFVYILLGLILCEQRPRVRKNSERQRPTSPDQAL